MRRNNLVSVADLIHEANRERNEQVAAQIAVLSCEISRDVIEIGLKNRVSELVAISMKLFLMRN